MKTTLKKFFLFQYTECDALEEYLEEMALKGWILSNVSKSLCYFTFQKAEPQKLIYSVQVFDKASIFDTQLTRESMEYIDYCQEAGWQFICNKDKIHIFVTADENAVPIETDEALKYQTIKKSMLKQNVFNWFVLPPLLIFDVLMPYFNEYESFVTSYLYLLLLLLLFLCLCLSASQLISFLLWCHRAKKNLTNNQPLPSYSKNNLKKRNRIRMIPIFLILLSVICFCIANLYSGDYVSAFTLIIPIIILCLTSFLCIWYYNQKFSRSTNIVLPIVIGIFSAFLVVVSTIVLLTFSSGHSRIYVMDHSFSIFSAVKPPLVMEDLGITPQKFRDSNNDVVTGTFLAQYASSYDNSYTNAQLNPSDKKTGISYSLFKSKYNFIINHYVKYKLNYYEIYKPSDASVWGAKKAFYEVNSHRYMAIYNHCVLLFRCDKPINQNMIKTIEEKLNLKEYAN
jgi:hypothetical protein